MTDEEEECGTWAVALAVPVLAVALLVGLAWLVVS